MSFNPYAPYNTSDASSYAYSQDSRGSSSGSSDDNYQPVSSGQYAAYINDIGQALQASSGSTQKALDAQMQNAKLGYANAVKLEQMRDQTTRYGIDVQSRDEMKKLTENARQFDSNHELDMAKFGLDKQRFGLEQGKFGLDYASQYANFMLSPDRYAAGSDFVNMASRALSGQGGPAPYGQTTFTPKTAADFAVLTGTQPSGAGTSVASTYTPQTGASSGSNQGGGSGASGSSKDALYSPAQSAFTDPTMPQPLSGAPGTQPAAGGAGTQYAEQAAAQGGAGSDARTAAIKKIFDAVPPSQEQGLSANDYAVLHAAGALMSTNLQPGTIERMRPDQRNMYKSYIQKSGRSWDDYLQDYRRQGISQGRTSQAA